MQLFITVVLWVVLGSITAHYAKERGRDPRSWFFIGLLLGVLGLIALFVMPRLKPKAGSPPQPVQPVAVLPIPEPVSHKFWYYLDPDNIQLGPMSFQGLESAWREGKVSLETYVWNEDLVEWKKFREFATATSPTKEE
ncbi:MAG: DUF4339 domain-containing protein [Chlamydiales bacterium]|nr:DUF4339 domain-containing protein [Chlamydiales bacterium]